MKNSIYKLRMELVGIEPPIWRSIAIKKDVPFWDLHVAIQSVMGWLDYHLHTFELKDAKTGEIINAGTPMPGSDDIKPDWEYYIEDYLNPQNKEILYRYDFGDNWEVLIKLMDMEDALPGKKYPYCIDGARNAPPEDVGGVPGYYEFVKIMKDPGHDEHENMLAWYESEYDPEHFKISDIKFPDPKKRFNEVYNEDEL